MPCIFHLALCSFYKFVIALRWVFVCLRRYSFGLEVVAAGPILYLYLKWLVTQIEYNIFISIVYNSWQSHWKNSASSSSNSSIKTSSPICRQVRTSIKKVSSAGASSLKSSEMCKRLVCGLCRAISRSSTQGLPATAIRRANKARKAKTADPLPPFIAHNTISSTKSKRFQPASPTRSRQKSTAASKATAKKALSQE